MESNSEKYKSYKRQNIQNIVSRLRKNEITIEELEDSQKDDLIQYYNNQISIHQKKIKEIRNKVKRRIKDDNEKSRMYLNKFKN